MRQSGNLLGQTDIKKEAGRRQGPLLPIAVAVITVLNREDFLVKVSVIRPYHHRIGMEYSVIGFNRLDPVTLASYRQGLLAVENFNAKFLGKGNHGIHDFAHAAHGVPGPQAQICIIH